MTRIIATVILIMMLFGCASEPSMNQQFMHASFYDMKEDEFSFRAVAPVEVIRDYAICKAIWFAEKKQAEKVSLSNPVYNNTPSESGKSQAVPDGWATVGATAYLSGLNPDGNPYINVSEMAASCRSSWDWYN